MLLVKGLMQLSELANRQTRASRRGNWDLFIQCLWHLPSTLLKKAFPCYQPTFSVTPVCIIVFHTVANSNHGNSIVMTACPELTLPVSMICNNIESRISFARQGLGLAYLPEFAIKEHLSDGSLRPVLTGYTKRTGVFYVLWPSGKHLTLKVRVLIDFLRKRVLLET